MRECRSLDDIATLLTSVCRNFSPSQVGTKPILISIDGGVDQTNQTGFNFNGESDLDLQYAFGLTNPQPILLLQTVGGDMDDPPPNEWSGTTIEVAEANLGGLTYLDPVNIIG